MSNPAVTKLQRKKIGRYEVWLDDNIGERMHLHINRFRVDLDYPEMDKLCKDICTAMNELVAVPGFDASKMDPVFLEWVLCTERCRLYDLESITDDEKKLSELWFDGDRLVRIKDSVYYRALCGSAEHIKNKGSDHIDQTPKERMDEILSSVREKGYPADGQYMILYGNNNIIKDGQHRAACLMKEKGDITVPVKRYHFRDYVPHNEKLQSSILGPLYMKFYRFADKTNSIKITFGVIKKAVKKLFKKSSAAAFLKEIYLLFNRSEAAKMRKLLDEV